MQEDKVFNTGNMLLSIRTYHNENPDLVIESQDSGGCLYFEFVSKEQLKEIMDYLFDVYDRWE